MRKKREKEKKEKKQRHEKEKGEKRRKKNVRARVSFAFRGHQTTIINGGISGRDPEGRGVTGEFASGEDDDGAVFFEVS